MRKFGRKAFKKEIIQECVSREEAYSLEKRLVTEEMLNDPQCYNLVPGGDGGNAVSFLYSLNTNDEEKNYFAEKTRQRMKNLHEFNTGRPLSPATKAKISEFHTGRTRPKETGERISAALSNKTKSDQHRENLKFAALNRPDDSEETRSKKSEAGKERCKNGFDMGFMRGKQYPKAQCEHCQKDFSINAIKRHAQTCKERKE